MTRVQLKAGDRVQHLLTRRCGTVVSTFDWHNNTQFLKVVPDGPLHEYGDAGPVDWSSARVELIQEEAA